jgi:drug/metabolite transporter (DMT)-like permease
MPIFSDGINVLGMANALSTRSAAALLAGIVLAWGVSWPVTKLVVQDVPPLWATAIRCMIASATLAPMLWMQGAFIVPRRGDLPVVVCTAVLHLTAFSALIAAGLRFVPAGRAIVLGYTTPIWVAIGAALFLSEAITRRRALGIVFGLAGLAVIFNPLTLNWRDGNVLYGSGLILLAAFCWAGNIVYVRAHRWISTPFQLVFWQVFLAAALLSATAWIVEGPPHIAWNARLFGLLLLSGTVCTAFANWAMTMVNRSLPAVTTSLCLLATPVLGIFCATLILNEPLEPSLFLAMALIIGGIALGTVTGGWPRPVAQAKG